MKTPCIVWSTACLFALLLTGCRSDDETKPSAWSPFTRIPSTGCYVSLIQRGTVEAPVLELWQNTWGEAGAGSRELVVARGPDIEHLGPALVVLNGTIITDVYGLTALPGTDPAQLAPGRGFTRSSVAWYPDIGYVLAGCVCPEYVAGTVSLLPAIAVSKTGEAGSWTYLGKLTGEPAALAAQRRIWSDGGSLIRLSPTRWRFYLNGYGPVLSALESESLSGPWQFLRDESGAIRELGSALPVKEEMRGGAIFPTVHQRTPQEWHCWVSDQWIPEKIYHLISKDGLDWKLYGPQPEITRASAGGSAIKCLRVYPSEDGRTLSGLLSVWERGEESSHWQLYHATMP